MQRILMVCSFCASAFFVHAQSSPADTKKEEPSVFLDNNRPLIPKKDKAPTSRTVTGTVTDDTGRPLEGALVTLTAFKTNEKRTVYTKKDGRYIFEYLAFTEDFQVQAKWKAMISEPRKLSQYDHSAKVVRLLQVQTPEGGAEAPTAKTADAQPSVPKH